MVNIPSEILNRVTKPARYTGQELNSIKKDHSKVDILFALAFPDIYEVGLSNLGYKILYDGLNKRIDTAAERVYAPWIDMEKEMRQANILLYALESFRPIKEFDVVGFSLQYEMSYTNVLNMLDLANISVKAEKRTATDPIIIAGGPCAFNPEPLAEFIDIFIIGEGEEILNDVLDIILNWKKNNKKGGKQYLLLKILKLTGVYVPSMYFFEYNYNGTIRKIFTQSDKIPLVIYKAIIKDLNYSLLPVSPIVPYISIIHDRIMLELFRGCTRGCRFCQAGMIYRPVRERKIKKLISSAIQMIENTGYNEISLISLSTTDYSNLEELIDKIHEALNTKGVNVSLPSLRIDSFSMQLALKVQKFRKSGLTFAPEAGTQRLRNVINKGVTEHDLFETVKAAFHAGWSSIKLYFMIGLPTETNEDVFAISELAKRINDLYKHITGRKGLQITVSVSCFVPKPHTAFQWFPQNTVDQLYHKQQILKSAFHKTNILYKWHDAEISQLEGVFARGDRKLCQVLYTAWQMGAKFDGWSENFKPEIWEKAFKKCSVESEFYTNRERDITELLPWDHISTGVYKKFLYREYKKALCQTLTKDCRMEQCINCGVCNNLGVQNISGKNYD